MAKPLGTSLVFFYFLCTNLYQDHFLSFLPDFPSDGLDLLLFGSAKASTFVRLINFGKRGHALAF